MARPRKTGLDYFPFDCDFFEDEKIVAIAGEFGIKGELAAIKLLCAIYRNGYFIEWSEMLKLKLLRQLPGVSSELFDQILNRLVRWGFFDASLFDSVKVLTSAGIQERYFEIVKRRIGNEKYLHLLVNVAETRVNVAETPQSKVNKIKENLSPGGDNAHPRGDPQSSSSKFTPPTLEEVKRIFRQQVNFLSEQNIEISGWEKEALKFFAYYNSQGWMKNNGKIASDIDFIAMRWLLDEKDKSNETDKKDRFSKRRGTEPGTKSRKDYF